MKPRTRRTLAEWAQTAYRLSQRRAARLIPARLETLRYQSTRDRQDALRQPTGRAKSPQLEAIQKRALAEGLPYQTLISSLLHKYASGRLKEV